MYNTLIIILKQNFLLEMKNKYLVIFIPSIEGGGVEKNLFIIANYLSSIDNNIKLITASRGFDKKFKNIDIIKPKLSFLKNTSRKFKYLICLLELLKLIIHHLGNLNQLFIYDSHTKCESLLPHVMYFYFIFITVKIVCITLVLKINNFKVNFYAKTCIPL